MNILNNKKEFSKKIIYCGTWICLYAIEESNMLALKNYECLKRTTKKKNLDYDALTILPIIKSKELNTRKVLLIAEYRPPVQSFVLELPAGLAESDNFFDDIEREMWEETGYAINKEKVNESPLIAGEPKLFEITAKIFTIEIDGDDEKNKNPKQKLEDGENIRIHLVDLDINFLENVKKLAEEKKYKIHDKIYFLGCGISHI